MIEGSLDSTAAAIEAQGQRALPVAMDLLDRPSIDAMVDTVVGKWGRIDALINNAIYQGPGRMDRVLELDLEAATKLVVGNYVNQLHLIQLVVPGMLERGGGRVVNMASATATMDPPAPAGEGGWGLGYGASKAAFLRVAGQLHVEFASQGLVAFNVDPGFTTNDKPSDEQFSKRFRGAPPEVTGAAIAWLCSSPTRSSTRARSSTPRACASGCSCSRGGRHEHHDRVPTRGVGRAARVPRDRRAHAGRRRGPDQGGGRRAVPQRLPLPRHAARDDPLGAAVHARSRERGLGRAARRRRRRPRARPTGRGGRDPLVRALPVLPPRAGQLLPAWCERSRVRRGRRPGPVPGGPRGASWCRSRRSIRAGSGRSPTPAPRRTTRSSGRCRSSSPAPPRSSSAPVGSARTRCSTSGDSPALR